MFGPAPEQAAPPAGQTRALPRKPQTPGRPAAVLGLHKGATQAAWERSLGSAPTHSVLSTPLRNPPPLQHSTPSMLDLVLTLE